MVAGCSEGMHGRQLCSSDEGGGSRAARVVGREFCLLVSTRGARRAQLLACDAQQLAASSTALWQLA